MATCLECEPSSRSILARSLQSCHSGRTLASRIRKWFQRFPVHISLRTIVSSSSQKAWHPQHLAPIRQSISMAICDAAIHDSSRIDKSHVITEPAGAACLTRTDTPRSRWGLFLLPPPPGPLRHWRRVSLHDLVHAMAYESRCAMLCHNIKTRRIPNSVPGTVRNDHQSFATFEIAATRRQGC